MKSILCISALITYVFAVSVSIAGIDKHPYQVNIQYRKYLLPFASYEHLCSGSIYSDRLIITAADCVIDSNPRHYRVIAGSNLLNGNSGSFASVKELIVHENYSTNSHQNDIAILVLKDSLPLNGRTMKSIPFAEQNPTEGTMATTAGWSAMSKFGDESDVLRDIQIPIVGRTVCNKDFNGRVYNKMICAGYRGADGNDACQEDNGAPLVVDDQLVGILSWGMGCALPDYPGVYTSIPQVRSWLMQKINSL